MSVIQRRIWKTGKGTYVTSFPRKWVHEFIKKFGDEVIISLGEYSIIITPAQEKIINLEINPTDEITTKMKIVSAYLKGYNKARILSKVPLEDEIINKICAFVPGAVGVRVGVDKGELFFTELPYDQPVENLIDIVKETFREFKKDINNCFSVFPSKESIEGILKSIKYKEGKLDQILYYLKRALAKPDSYGRLGIEIGDIAILDSLFSNIERIGDLHEKITKRILKISKEGYKNINLMCFLEFYNIASEILFTAIDALKNPERGLEVIKGKRSKGWISYKGGIMKEKKEAMKDYIKSLEKEDSTLIRHLTILEGKLRAIPLVASNICEFAYNWRGLIKELY